MKRNLLIITGLLLVGGAIIVIRNFSDRSTSSSAIASGASHRHWSFSEKSSSSTSSTKASSSPFKSSPLLKTAPASNLPTGTGGATTSEIGGTPVWMAVKVNGKEIVLKPNECGMFPRIPVSANEKIRVSVAYTEGTPEDPLVIQAEDGGKINGKSVVFPSKLDQNGVISFEFQTMKQEGSYRVTLRKGVDEKRLDFWVGKELEDKKKS